MLAHLPVLLRCRLLQVDTSQALRTYSEPGRSYILTDVLPTSSPVQSPSIFLQSWYLLSGATSCTATSWRPVLLLLLPLIPL